jgi:hypothetical protein
MAAIAGLLALVAVAVTPPVERIAPQTFPGAKVSGGAAAPAGERTQPRCPYGFRSQMPPGVFCVYQGTAFQADGKPCAQSVWAIWSSYSDGSASPISDTGKDAGTVAVGLLSEPEMVFRGAADRADASRAGFAGYFLGDDPEMHPSAGMASLHETAGDASQNRLVLTFTGSDVPQYEGCSLSRYEGTLIGVLGDPSGAPPGRLVFEEETRPGLLGSTAR